MEIGKIKMLTLKHHCIRKKILQQDIKKFEFTFVLLIEKVIEKVIEKSSNKSVLDIKE